MKVLLDTHSLVWAISQPERLSPRGLKILEKHEMLASVVSLWELILKKSKKDGLIENPVEWWNLLVANQGIQVISVHARHVVALDRLPDIHKDPFDRLLVAQAVVEGASILSRDRALSVYDVPVIW